MSSDRQRRARGLAPLSELRLPAGAPARLRAARRLARVRDALGPALGPHLAAVQDEGAGVRLVFAGSGWERALAGAGPEIAARVAALLDCRPEAVVLASDVGAPDLRTVAAPPRRPEGDDLERLRRAAARLLDRGNGPANGSSR